MQVKVWNDNIHDFTDPNFKGQQIVVKAKGFIEMDYEEAVEFRGKFASMPPEDCLESEVPKYFKMIRVEQPRGGVVPIVTEYVCQLTGKKFGNLDDYKKHLVASASLYADQIAVDQTAEKEIEEKKKRTK